MTRREVVAYCIIVPVAFALWLDVGGGPQSMSEMLFAVPAGAVVGATLVWLAYSFAGFRYTMRTVAWSAAVGGAFLSPIVTPLFGKPTASNRASALALLLMFAGIAMLIGAVCGIFARIIRGRRRTQSPVG